jgi:hypothetical protein
MANPGQAAARAAIAAWFAPSQIPGLATTYPSTPTIIPASAYTLASGAGSGSVLVVHLPAAQEVRIAMGGPTSGEKFNKYTVVLEVKFRSVKSDAMAAQADQDALIDAIYARWRQDRTFGTSPKKYTGSNATIWQAGEGAAGIKMQQVQAILDDNTVIIGASITGELWLYIAA